MALRIGFDATAAVHQAAGIGRYTRLLLSALASRFGDEEYRTFYCGHGADAGTLPHLNNRFRVRSIPVSDRVMNGIWHRARLPLPVQTFTGSIDLFHSPDFTLPPTPRIPSVLTVHDLAFLRVPDCAYPTLRTYLERVVPRSAQRADRIIAVSESTRRDVIELLGIPPERVSTVHEGVGQEFRTAPNREYACRAVRELGITASFILSVGTLEPRKNYIRLFEAYRILRDRGIRHQFVVAGRPGWMYEPVLKRRSELRLDDYVTIVNADDHQLSALYTLCDAFVYGSLYEGFGIPPLEALASAAPVACSGSSSLPEVVGDAAVTFDPLDVEAIAHAIYRLLDDQELAQDLRTRGPQQAAKFSWARAADETVRIYHEVARA